MQSEKRLWANNHKEMIEAPSSDICLVSEWLANLDNQQTRRAYRSDIQDFFVLVGARSVEDLLEIPRGHVICAGAISPRYDAAIARSVYSFVRPSG
jgi:hypothetical protein